MPKFKKSFKKHASQTRPGNSASSALNLRVLAGVAIIVLAVFLAYLPALNGGFILDDDKLLTDNSIIKSPDGLYQFWCTTEALDYWPVSNSALWLEWRVWGMKPTGYHVTNLILHIVEVLLVWIILQKLSLPGAFWAALVFAVHPVNVESVAWIASRKNLMAMLFFLLSVLCYLNFEIPSPYIQDRLNWKKSSLAPRSSPLASCLWYGLSFLAFVLAMLSKGSVAILPVLLLGIVWWLRPLTRWDLLRAVPFLLVAVVLAGVNVWFQTHGLGEVYRSASFIERLLGAGGVVWFYLYKALLPLDLYFVYPLWHISAGNLLWWLPLMAALVVTALLWRYREGWSRPLMFAWGFFCVSLIPVLGFTDVGFMRFTLVADRYQHIAIIGAIALAAAGWSLWHERARGATLWTTRIVAILTAGALMFLTSKQCEMYHDSITLYQIALEKNPDFWMGHSNLGALLTDAGRFQESIEHCQQALRLKPNYADAQNNLGNALLKSDRPREAIEHYQKALQLKPEFPEAHNNFGAALFLLNRPREAIDHYKQALRLNPDYAEAYYNQGNTLRTMGQHQQAIDCYHKALRLKPDYLDAYNNLGLALYEIDQPRESIAYFQQALQIDPNHSKARFNLGNSLKALGQYQQAIEYYQKTLLLKPDYIEAHNNLGVALIQAGRPREAIEHYQQALRLKPDLSEAYYNLALAYAEIHESSQAVVAAQKALDIAGSKGQKALVKHVENWLKTYRDSLSK